MSGPGIEIIGDLGYLFLVCAGVGLLAYLFRQPLVLGFLIAGIFIGPFGPFSLIKNVDVLNNFADIAIVLLLFGVGLTFPLSQLRAIGKIGTIIAVVEIFVMLGIGYGVGTAFGWSFYDSLFLAAALSVSSTAIIVKVLEDMGVMEEDTSKLLIGILIIEDLAATVLLSSMHSSILIGSFELETISWKIVELGLFIGGTIILGVLAMPKIFSFISNLERYEFTVLAAVGLAFGLSYLSYQLGFSAATGAFLAGVIIAGTKFSDEITNLLTPTREIFVAIFFVTIGALMDFQIIVNYWIPIVIITIVTIFGKTLGTYLGIRLLGAGHQNAIGLGLSMAQLGEFSFIFLKAGQDLGVTSPTLLPIVGMVVILTTLVAPFLIKRGTRMLTSSY